MELAYRKSERDDYVPIKDEFVLVLVGMGQEPEWPCFSVHDVNGCWEVFNTLAVEHTLLLLEDIYRDLEKGWESAVLLREIAEEVFYCYFNGPEHLRKEYLSVDGVVSYRGLNSHLRSLSKELPEPVYSSKRGVSAESIGWDLIPWRWDTLQGSYDADGIWQPCED